MHQATLVGDRTFVAVAPPAATATATSTSSAASSGDLAKAQTLRAAAAANAAPLAYLEPGAIGRISSCPAASDWCRVQIKGVSGFLPRAAMWGLLPDEVVATH